MTEVPGPSVGDSVRAVAAKAAAGGRGDPLTGVQATDMAVLVLGGAGLLTAVLVAARHRVIRH